MILGLGSDIIEVARIEESIKRHGKRFLDRIFTPSEQAYCLSFYDSGRHFAGRFAAKEAIVKALGTGISGSISWLDIEILNDPNGKPLVYFSASVEAQFSKPEIQISLSHCKSHAMAVAIWSKLK